MNLTNKLQEKVVEYCNTLSFEELRGLAIYLGSGIENNQKPTEKEQDFCEVFLGAVNYATYLRIKSEIKESYFSGTKTIGYEINELYSFVSFQTIIRSSEVLLQLSDEKVKSSKLELKIANKNLERAKLKEDLSKAILNSYEDNIFYKDDGFCNLSDVLIKHKLLELKD